MADDRLQNQFVFSTQLILFCLSLIRDKMGQSKTVGYVDEGILPFCVAVLIYHVAFEADTNYRSSAEMTCYFQITLRFLVSRRMPCCKRLLAIVTDAMYV